MNLQNPKKFKLLIDQAHQVAINVLRPISRKYDKAEHSYPKELDMLASLVDGMNEGGEGMNAGAAVGKRGTNEQGNKNGVNLSTALSVIEMCYGDTALLLSMPRQGLGNSAIAAVANEEQLQRFKGSWAAMAITEPARSPMTCSIAPRTFRSSLSWCSTRHTPTLTTNPAIATGSARLASRVWGKRTRSIASYTTQPRSTR